MHTHAQIERFFLQAHWLEAHELAGSMQSMQIFVNASQLTTFQLTLWAEPSNTIETLKGKIRTITGLRPDRQRVMFEGQQLQDGRTLFDYNIQNGSTLDVYNLDNERNLAEMLEFNRSPHDEAAEQPTDEVAWVDMAADEAAGRPTEEVADEVTDEVADEATDAAAVWTDIGFAVLPGTSRASDISEAYKQGHRHGYIHGFDQGYAQGRYNGWRAGCHATSMHQANLAWSKGCQKGFEQGLVLGKGYKDGKSGNGGPR